MQAEYWKIADPALIELLASPMRQEIVDTLGAAKIPAGPVLSPQQALDHPHIRAAGGGSPGPWSA